VWLFEIGEMSGMTRSEIEAVKAFTSRTEDRSRKAYGRTVERVRRTCIFIGTMNPDGPGYLKDQTGNRRFWPVLTGKVDLDALRRDRDMIWAEAAHREAAGEAIVLDEGLWPDAAEAQEQRREVDPWEAILEDIPPGYITVVGDEERIPGDRLLHELLDVAKAQVNGSHARRLSSILRRLGWLKHAGGKVYINGKHVRGYWRKASDLPKGSAPKEGVMGGRRWQL
jgi:predicted P-loop ATPase